MQVNDIEQRMDALLSAHEKLVKRETAQRRGLGMDDDDFEEGKLEGFIEAKEALRREMIDQVLESDDRFTKL